MASDIVALIIMSSCVGLVQLSSA